MQNVQLLLSRTRLLPNPSVICDEIYYLLWSSHDMNVISDGSIIGVDIAILYVFGVTYLLWSEFGM